ncbi:hypothetical protein [Mycobacterium conspicuum]|jgi:hypothetical protein|uniref:Uncharacterized protein n=2 Tax=Mycobacterium conspicuum TaxID=44010 RepID=A0A7I7Y9B0_9MYCO|nr:hypothetical protein [Mycobacterium conspicuum]BBZ38295.1 hypothetical protein MCNS_13580 [Mycobacterium conspicuum]
MSVSPAVLANTAEPAEQPAVVITPQQVLLGTAAAAGVRRAHPGGRLVAAVRRMFATSTASSRAPRPRPRYQPKRYAYLENAAMARAMERL